MNNNNKSKSRILLISLTFSLFILTTFLIFTVPPKIIVSYGHTIKTDDGISINFSIFEPKNQEGQKLKAVIIGHGVIVNKEFLKGYAIELANAGFLAITFDFRGHGRSTGELIREDLVKDIKAIKEYLRSRGDVDMDNLGYIGYSMAGTPGWEIVYEDDSFKCFIGIGTFIPYEDRDKEYIIKANSGRFLNVLMILARYDQAFTLEQTKEGMGERLNMNPNDVDVNKLYGSFEEGNASMIYLDDNSDHLTTAYDQDFIREARDWVKNTFPDVRPVDENFYVNVRAWIFLFQISSGLILFFLTIKPLSNKIIERKEKESIHFEIKNNTIKSLSLKTIIYSLIFGIPGMILMLPLILFLPLTTAGAMLTFLFGMCFAITLLLWRVLKKNNTSLKDVFVSSFKRPKGTILRFTVLGLLLAILLYIILVFTIGFNYAGIIPSINKIVWMPIYFVIAFFIFIIFGVLFHIIIQSQFENNAKGLLKSIILNFGLLMVYMFVFIIIPCILLKNFFLIIVLTFAGPILLLNVSISTILYKNTGNIISGAIVNTFFVVCIIVTLSPFINVINLMLEGAAL
ncbi:MAG: alpha/beta hydrolase [Promethearchaeota archaeon]